MNKLLQINSVVNFGSTGRIAEEIGVLAMSQGWHSYIAYGRKNGVSQSEVIKIGSQMDLHAHGLATRLFDRHGFASSMPTRNLISKIEKIKPDIIHLHNLHGYYININLLCNYLADRNFPLVWTLHDCWAITGHCANFESINCNKWIDGCHHCPQRKSYPASYFADQSRRNYNEKKLLFTSFKEMAIVSVSKWLGNIIQRSYLAKYPIEIINSGINMDTFKPVKCNRLLHKYNLKNKFIILGVVNDWNRNKGFFDFIELGRRLSSDYQIVMLGLNNFQISHIPSNIVGIPRTNNPHELAEFYSFADVFLNATYEESFSTTNLEAVACGTPVITYDAGGSTESILPTTGIIVQKGDIEGLKNAVSTVRTKGKSYYSNYCYHHARLNYNMNDRYGYYLKLYSKILH